LFQFRDAEGHRVTCGIRLLLWDHKKRLLLAVSTVFYSRDFDAEMAPGLVPRRAIRDH
jgi:hypothetical protein